MAYQLVVRRLQDIKLRLRSGQHPREFAEMLSGIGAQRTVWLCGDFVIKERTPAWQHDRSSNEYASPCPVRALFTVPVKPLARVGIHAPVQWRAANWVIQPYYRALTTEEWAAWQWINTTDVYWRPTKTGKRVRLDLHCNNLGVNLHSGTVHAIDW